MLTMYNYKYYHIQVEESVWANLLAGWCTVRPTIERLIGITELPSACADDFDWPSLANILTSQLVHEKSRLRDLVINED